MFLKMDIVMESAQTQKCLTFMNKNVNVNKVWAGLMDNVKFVLYLQLILQHKNVYLLARKMKYWCKINVFVSLDMEFIMEIVLIVNLFLESFYQMDIVLHVLKDMSWSIGVANVHMVTNR